MATAAIRGWRPARAWALAAFWLALPAIVRACPTCKNGLDDPQAHGFAIGIFLSIVVMLGTFGGIVGFFIYKLVKGARLEAAAAAAAEAAAIEAAKAGSPPKD